MERKTIWRICLALAFAGFATFSETAGASEASFFRRPPVADRILTVEEMRNFWINSLPVPREPRIDEPGYGPAWRDYAGRIENYRSQVRAISEGFYDAEAQRFVLEHNREVWLRRGDLARAEGLERELEVLMRFREERRRERELRGERQMLLKKVAALEAQMVAMERELQQLRKPQPVAVKVVSESPPPPPQVHVVERVIIQEKTPEVCPPVTSTSGGKAPCIVVPPPALKKVTVGKP